MTVLQGEITQTTTCGDPGHGRHVDHGHEQEGEAQDERAHGLWDEQGQDDPQPGCTSGAGRFDHPGVDADQARARAMPTRCF